MTYRIKTLILDDDPTILTLLEEVFRQDDSLHITTLSDSQVAYDRLATDKFDLIITDLMMPNVDGLRILDQAVSHNPEVLVVIVTGYASLETTLEAIHAGVYDYITKPFRVEEFRLLVHNAAGRIRLLHENRRLIEENRETGERLGLVESRYERQQRELHRLREELGRRADLVTQTGGQAAAMGEPNRARLSSYEKGMETAGERYDRELQNIEDMFSSGRLTPEEFEMARQRLKTMI